MNPRQQEYVFATLAMCIMCNVQLFACLRLFLPAHRTTSQTCLAFVNMLAFRFISFNFTLFRFAYFCISRCVGYAFHFLVVSLLFVTVIVRSRMFHKALLLLFVRYFNYTFLHNRLDVNMRVGGLFLSFERKH